MFKKRAVDCCCIDDSVVFIGCKDGRIYVYDLVWRILVQVFDLMSCEEEIKRKSKEVKNEKPK